MSAINFSQSITPEYINDLSKVATAAKDGLGFLGKVTVGGQNLGWAVAAITSVGAIVAGVLFVTSSIPVAWPAAFLLTDLISLATSYGLSYTDAVKTNNLAGNLLSAKKRADSTEKPEEKDADLLKLLNKVNLSHLEKLCKGEEDKIVYFNTRQEATLHSFFKAFNDRKIVVKAEGEAPEIVRSKNNIKELKKRIQSLINITNEYKNVEFNEMDFDGAATVNDKKLAILERIIKEDGFIAKMDATIPPEVSKDSGDKGKKIAGRVDERRKPGLNDFIKALRDLPPPAEPEGDEGGEGDEDPKLD